MLSNFLDLNFERSFYHLNGPEVANLVSKFLLQWSCKSYAEDLPITSVQLFRGAFNLVCYSFSDLFNYEVKVLPNGEVILEVNSFKVLLSEVKDLTVALSYATNSKRLEVHFYDGE